MTPTHDQQTPLLDLADGGPLGPGAAMLPHERFVKLAERYPNRPAVACGTERLTYGQLLAQSGQLAQTLRDLELESEAVVGACLPRRPAMVAAMLAVFMAGATYLPLDPTYPVERRRFMLGHAEATVLLTTSAWAPELEGSVDHVLTFDGTSLPVDANRSPVPPPPSTSDAGLAYIMYTSGSTGKPKGVMVEQSGLAAFVDWGVSAFSTDELASVLASTSVGFDISLFELLVPLAAGGCIVLVDNLFQLRSDRHAEVTLVNTVPSLIAAFLRTDHLPAGVRTVVLAGEPLSAGVAAQVHEQPRVQRLVNAYGPTEDTIYSTFSEVAPGSTPLIGRPLPGTRAFVLEEGHLSARHGAEGELYLAGAGLARGYRGRADLTEDRFVREAPAGASPELMYRTGDLARWEDDGSLRHLGRADDQIKIRGVRIEPGEVETALLRHADIRQAAVIARSREEERHLVAYVVFDGGVHVGSQELRTLLRESLPEAMVPSLFMPVSELPVTPNGKLDRGRLPEVGIMRTGSLPETETERRLAEIWRDVLELDELPGARDDFFELGGQSLLALKLIDRIAADFGCELYPEALVDASTLGGLATSIDAGVEVANRLVTINRDGTRPPCIYIAAGAGGLLPLRAFGEVLGPDQPIYGIPAYAERAERNERDLLSIEDTATDCFRLIRTLQPSGPYTLAGHSIGGHVAFELACRLQAEGERVAFLALLDPAAPHTLTSRGRAVARVREMVGRGPEGRRSGFARAGVSMVTGLVKSRLPGGRSPVAEVDDEDEDARWMRTLETVESHYQPKGFHGDVTVFTTAGMARATGSRTLGWDRYVAGSIEARRVGGGHNSMLKPPHVSALAGEFGRRLDAVQQELA